MSEIREARLFLCEMSAFFLLDSRNFAHRPSSSTFRKRRMEESTETGPETPFSGVAPFLELHLEL